MRDFDKALAHLKLKEPRLTAVIASLQGQVLEVDPYGSPYHALCRAIVYQQLSGKAAATIYGRFRALFDGADYSAEKVLVLEATDLRKVGVSMNKANAILDLSSHVVNGQLPGYEEMLTMDDQQIIDRLTQVRGIGEWTAQMLLIFRLGRPNVLPCGDLAVRKGVAKLLGLEKMPVASEMQALTEHWIPYRSVGSWLMWRSLDTVL